jgi:serine/threonine protein kinase
VILFGVDSGYMSPEYALDGYFSTKSDVFSFGVVLFEIISGKRNTGFFRSKEISSLLGYVCFMILCIHFLCSTIILFYSNIYSFYQAWRLWREEKLQDLMDPSLSDSYNVNQFIRCAQIALLCVQDEPDDRPHMSNVVTMLDNETTTLLTPKQPTFFSRKEISSTASSSQQIESSIQEGR